MTFYLIHGVFQRTEFFNINEIQFIKLLFVVCVLDVLFKKDISRKS